MQQALSASLSCLSPAILGAMRGQPSALYSRLMGFLLVQVPQTLPASLSYLSPAMLGAMRGQPQAGPQLPPGRLQGLSLSAMPDASRCLLHGLQAVMLAI